MSKLSPLGQSMASLFTPESERLRKGQSKAAEGGTRTPAGAMKIPGAQDIKGHKSGDSLGNPNSPGYDGPLKKKKNPAAEGVPAEDLPIEAGPAGVVIETATQGPELIRLSAGWEKLLVAQKKLCEKAKGLFTLLEGPSRYNSQKKNKMILMKSRGNIVDLDLQEVQSEKEAAAIKKAKESA